VGGIVAGIDDQQTWDIRPLGSDEVDVVVEGLGLARLHQGDGFYLVAWAGRLPVGHLHLALSEPPEIQDVEVRPSHRGRGVAMALIAAAEDAARARGFDEVRLEVSVDDAGARRLYRKCGYQDSGLPVRRVLGRIELRTGPIDVDDNLLCLSKRLDEPQPL
jgi:GNAT superfamily N-acetyltransferase